MSIIIELLRDNTVEFTEYRKGNLWYVIKENGFDFPVPITDCGDGIFKAKDKAMMFMRYVRKHLEDIKEENEKRSIL